MDKREDIIPIAKKYVDLVKASNLPMQIDKAYLFGSFAKGTPHKDSDIDIAFVVSNWKGGYFDTIVPVWGLGKDIDVRIEPHIIDPDEDYAYFIKEIQRTGIELN
jgi:predicted nucleotidyltransferase